MWSFGIVVPFDIFKNRELKLLQRMVAFGVCFFFLEIFEEAFAAGIVKWMAFFRKRLHNIKRIQKLMKCEGCVLGSPVGMEHKAIRGISFFVNLLEGSDNQFHIRIRRDMPCNNFSGVQIHHNTKIIPFPVCFYVGDIADPYEIGGFLVKVLPQVVGAGLVI